MDDKVIVINHPLIQHKLTLMRDKNTASSQFRLLLKEISYLMAYEVTKDIPLGPVEIDTPLSTMKASVIAGKKLVLVSVLRAGEGLLDGFLEIMPSIRVGHIGMSRDDKTLQAHEYLFKMPEEMTGRSIIILDPMLATGKTAVAVVKRLKELSPQSIKFLSLIAAPEGIRQLRHAHPDVTVYTAAIDQRLNEKGYIVPGLGDAGDRLYGTR